MKQAITLNTLHLHPHKAVIDTNIALGLAVKELLKEKTGGSDSTNMAIEKMVGFIEESTTHKLVKEWWKEVESGDMEPAFSKKMGWVKIGF